MNDRELSELELAAKAAGFEFADKLIPEAQGKRKGPFILKSRWTQWNPITDDGDALRLAVKLGLLVYVFHDPAMTCIRLPGDRIGGKYDEVAMHGNDQFAATRRAIVRAAAEIGRQMKEGGAAMRCAYTKEEVRGAMLEALTRIRALPVHADAIRMAHKHAEDAIAKAAKGEA